MPIAVMSCLDVNGNPESLHSETPRSSLARLALPLDSEADDDHSTLPMDRAAGVPYS